MGSKINGLDAVLF